LLRKFSSLHSWEAPILTDVGMSVTLPHTFSQLEDAGNPYNEDSYQFFFSFLVRENVFLSTKEKVHSGYLT